MPVKSRKTVELSKLRVGDRFITLDVSSSATGWAVGHATECGCVIEDFGVVKPPASWDFERKMYEVCHRLSRIIVGHNVFRVAMEWQSHKSTHNRVQGLAVLGQAQGAVWQFLAPRYRVVRVSERTWTKINGKNAKKETRQAAVKQRCPEYAAKVADDPKFDKGLDASDAIGLAFWWSDQGVDAHGK